MVEDDIDEQYFETVETVFDEDEGSRFWREVMEEELSFDPREVESAEEGLQRLEEELGFISSDRIRETPLRDLVPEAYHGEDGNEYSSGGRTAAPKWIFYTQETKDFLTENFAEGMKDRGLTEDLDWISTMPSEPHSASALKEAGKEMNDGMVFDIDLDPRWVRKTRTQGLEKANEAYQNHLKKQIQDIMETQYRANDDWVFLSTPPIVEEMAESGVMEKMDPSALVLAGAPIEPENLKYLDEQVLPDTEVIMGYGNTMAGICMGEIQGDGTVEYPSPEPVTLYEVRDPENPEETVDYGEEGRLLLHRLTPEYFLPNFLEDDAVTRHESRDGYEWDWVGNPHVPEEEQEDIETGVY